MFRLGDAFADMDEAAEHPSKIAASNLARLQAQCGEVDEALTQAVTVGEAEIGWVQGPAPPAVALPTGEEFKQEVSPEALVIRELRPMAPMCVRTERGVPEWLEDVPSWPCNHGDIHSDAEMDGPCTRKQELEDMLATVIAERVSEQATERAQAIWDDLSDLAEEEAADRLDEMRLLLEADPQTEADHARRNAVVADASAAVQPYSGRARATARRTAAESAEATRNSDEAWGAAADANTQADIRTYLEPSLPLQTADTPGEPSQNADGLGLYKTDSQTIEVVAHRPIPWQSGASPQLAEELLQKLPKNTQQSPCAGTKTVPWLVISITPKRDVEMPSLDTLYDMLRTGMGDSVQHIGLKRREELAVVLVKKNKARSLKLPELHDFLVEVRGINFPKGKGSSESEKHKITTVAAWLDLEGEAKTCISLKFTELETSKARGKNACASAAEAFEFVKDMKPRQFCLYCADLKIRVKCGDELSAIENTVLKVRSDLEHMRDSRARAKSFIRLLGEDATDLIFPDSFISTAIGDVKGSYRDVVSGRDVTCSLATFTTTTLHLVRTAVLCGPPDCGKTPLAESMAARFAEMYQVSGEYYVVTSTPDSLRILADEELLAPGVPVIMEELEAKDRKSHARPLTANVMKHLCGVRDGGVLSARYRDFAFHRKQPRIICCNSDPESWLSDITMDKKDQLAIRKRTVFFEINTPVISAASDDGLNVELQAFLAEGVQRLAEKRMR